jgi:hypothetical protein
VCWRQCDLFLQSLTSGDERRAQPGPDREVEQTRWLDARGVLGVTEKFSFAESKIVFGPVGLKK